MNTELQNPFPGLRSFGEEEDYLFFGREEQTLELVSLLRQHRFLAVVGTSGSGKSSLVRAGLLPALHGGTMAQAGSTWEVVVMKPGGAPIENLARTLIEADFYDAGDAESQLRLEATLTRSRKGLVEAIKQSDADPASNILIVVDQFEEIFRFRQQGISAQEAAGAFVDLLLEASRQSDHNLFIALTMRSDYLGDCAQIPGLAEAVNDGEYLIPRLGRRQRRDAIEKPVQVGGGSIAERLVQRLLNDVGDDADQLPVLQHALMRTWDVWTGDHQDEEPIDLKHYELAGGMESALSLHADSVYDALPDDAHREIAGRLFKALTERTLDSREIRRPLKLGELQAIVGDGEGAKTVIDAYRAPGVTFLMPSSEIGLSADTVVDISHESLMRVWSRLRAWVDEEAQSAGIYHRLLNTARLWGEGQAGLYHDPDLSIAQAWREECEPNAAWASLYGGGFEMASEFLDKSHEEVRREDREREEARQREVAQARDLAESRSRAAALLKRFAATVGVAAVLAIGLAVWAMQQSKEARKQKTRAEKQTALAVEAESLAKAAAVTAENAQGRTWLANARTLVEGKNYFGARLKAMRAVGFEGFGRDHLAEDQKNAFPVLLQKDSPTGGEAAKAAWSLVTSNSANELLWQSGSLAQHPAGINSIDVSSDGRFAASVSEGERLVRVWDLATGELHELLETSLENPEVVGFSPDSRYLALAGDSEMTFWTINNREFSPGPGLFRVKPLGSDVIGQDQDQDADAKTDEQAPPADFRSMAFSPDGQTLVLGDDLGRLYVWRDWSSFENFPDQPTKENPHTGRIVGVKFQPGGGTVLATVSSADNFVTLLDGKTFTVLDQLVSEPAEPDEPAEPGEPAEPDEGNSRKPSLRTLSFSDDGTLLAVGGDYLPVTIWGVPDGVPVATLFRDEYERLNVAEVDGKKMKTLGFSCPSLTFSRSGSQLAVAWGQRGGGGEPRWYGPVLTLFDVAGGGPAPKSLRAFPLDALFGFDAHFTPDDKGLLLGLRFGGQGQPSRLRLLDLEENPEAIKESAAHAGRIESLCFSPDGTLFASADQFGSIRIWEARTGHLRHTIRAHFGRVNEICFSADGRRLFSIGNEDQTLSAWDLQAGASPETAIHVRNPLGDTLVALELTPGGESLVVGGYSNKFLFFDPETLTLQSTRVASHGNQMRFTPDGKQAAVCRNPMSGPPELIVYNLAPGDELQEVMTPREPLPDTKLVNLAFSRDGLTMAIAFQNGEVRTWRRDDDRGWTESVVLTMPDGARDLRVTFTSGSRILTGDSTGQVRLWSRAGELLASLPTPDAVTALRTSPDGDILVTGSRQGLLQMWTIDSGVGIVDRLEGIGAQNTGNFWSNGATAIAVARKSRLVYTASQGSGPHPYAIQAWHLRGGRLRPAFVLEGSSRPGAMELSPSERYLAATVSTENDDSALMLWDLEAGTHRVIRKLDKPGKLVFTPDEKTLVFDQLDGGPDTEPMQFWDLAADEGPVAELGPFLDSVFGCVFTPDGKRLIIGDSRDAQPLRVYDFDSETRAATLTHTIPENSGRLTKIAISPDGSFFASASSSQIHTKLWNLPDLTPRGPHPVIELGGWAFSTAISPDGNYVAVGGGWSKVAIARTDGSGEIVASFEGPSTQGYLKFATDLEFDDNRTLLASFNDGTIIVYRLAEGGEVADPERYLQVIDLEEAADPVTWKVRNERLSPPESSLSFTRIGESYLSFLDGMAPGPEARIALFDHYLTAGEFAAAHAVALSADPEEGEGLWTQLSSALANALVQAKIEGDGAAAGPIRHLALRVFESHPPNLETQLTLLIENSDWEKIGALLRERLPELPPGEAEVLLRSFFDDLDNYLRLLLPKADILSGNEPSLPPREMLLASTLYEAAGAFQAAWEIDPWRLDSVFDDLSPAGLILEALSGRNYLMPPGGEWNYYRKPGAPEPGWNQPDYDDRAWKSAKAPLGYNRPGEKLIEHGSGEMISVPKTKETGQLAFYFRREFETPDGWDGAVQDLSASFLLDDGLVLYLDGRELLRHNLPAGELTPESMATTSVGDEKASWIDRILPPLALSPGRHLLAAEIHQCNEDSSDILLDLALLLPPRDPWRSLESLQRAVDFLTGLDPEHKLLPWVAGLAGHAVNSSEAAFQSALRAGILVELGAREEALAVADQRLGELASSYDPVLVGERKRWLRWKVGILGSLARPQAELDAIQADYEAVPPRDPGLDTKLIDLTDYYTRSFYKRVIHETAIPETFVPQKGVSYDLRGAIELNSGLLDIGETVADIRLRREGYELPDKVEGIAIGQKTKAIHFLLNTFWGRETEAVEVGKFILHYEDGTSAERPLVFLDDVVDWWDGNNKPRLPKEKISWENPRPQPPISLTELTWEHPYPEKTITSLDFVSSLRKAAPFLMGITLE